MAQAGVVLDRDQFNCSICLDVLRDPVTIPCGHSYCSPCVQSYWDQGDCEGDFMCPQCRKRFSPRPPLARSTMLADVVDKFRKTGLLDAAAATAEAAADASSHGFAEAGDVECDVCTGSRKKRAARSCLVCLASYCDVHVRPHYESAAFKKHRLVSASQRLREAICPRHDKLLEVYCRTDGCCICHLCLTDEHKGHDTVMAEAEFRHRQQRISDMKQSCQLQVEAREKDAQQLSQAIHSLTRSAKDAAAASDATFDKLIESIRVKCFEVRGLIEEQEKMAVGQAMQLLDRIQRDVNDMKKSQAEMDKLCHTEDHVHFLQSSSSFNVPPELSALPPVAPDCNLSFGLVMTAVEDFTKLALEVFEDGFACIYERVKEVEIVSSLTPLARIDEEWSSAVANAIQMEPAPETHTTGLDQAPNPFLPRDPILPTFNLGSPFVAKYGNLGARQRQFSKRPNPRRK